MNATDRPVGIRDILIPWDGLTPIAQVTTFARTLGGEDARLLLLPLLADSAVPLPADVGAIEVMTHPEVMTSPAAAIISSSTERQVDLVLLATPCQASKELEPACLASQVALESTIPAMVVHFSCDDFMAFPPLITRVLVPLDGSARAARALTSAGAIASRLHVPVHLVMIIDPKQALPPSYRYDPDATATMVASLTLDAHWALTRAERMLAAYDVEVNSAFLYGPVIETLEAEVEPGDVVVMTTHGVGAAPRWQLGSVAARLLVDIPVPLVIMRGSSAPEVAESDIQSGGFVPIARPTN